MFYLNIHLVNTNGKLFNCCPYYYIVYTFIIVTINMKGNVFRLIEMVEFWSVYVESFN